MLITSLSFHVDISLPGKNLNVNSADGRGRRIRKACKRNDQPAVIINHLFAALRLACVLADGCGVIRAGLRRNDDADEKKDENHQQGHRNSDQNGVPVCLCSTGEDRPLRSWQWVGRRFCNLPFWA